MDKYTEFVNRTHSFSSLIRAVFVVSFFRQTLAYLMKPTGTIRGTSKQNERCNKFIVAVVECLRKHSLKSISRLLVKG